MSRKSWIEETFLKRECVKFIPSSRDLHRCFPVCQVCQNLIRCCCGRLIGEHLWEESLPPMSLCPAPGQDLDEDWSMELHTKATPTNAYGTIDFQDTATRVCRAKFVRVAVDSRAESVLQLMQREWQMDKPKLLLTVHGGSENFSLPLKVRQAFSKGLITAALSTGAWILTDGINTGVSKFVGEAVKMFGGHDLRKRNTVGLTPWGLIDNNTDLVGPDVFRHYQPLGNPLSKRACLNGFHSHFLLVDDGTLGKHGCQQGLRRKLEKHIQLQKIHPRLNHGVPVVCVLVEGGAALVSTVLDYVSSVPPVPVIAFEGSGRAADLLAFFHKQTADDRHLVGDMKEDFLVRIGDVFKVDRAESSHLYDLFLQCMDHRQSITIFDSESEDQMTPDAAILSATLKGTRAGPAEQLSLTLAWDRADVAQKDVLLYGQHWQVGSLERAMLDALVMDRVSFVKLLIDNGMTMSRFLTVDRLEELYNTPQGQTDRFLRHLVEDAKQTSLPLGYRLSIIDMGVVVEYLIGGAYRSTYTRKHFRAAYCRLQDKEGRRMSSASFYKQRRGLISSSLSGRSLQEQQFFRTAQPYKSKHQDVSLSSSSGVGGVDELTLGPGLVSAPPLAPFNFNDLFVWAVLQQRQQMALFLWQHGEEALARATVACKLYRSMAFEARQSNMDDNMADRFKAYSLEFGQLAVDVLDTAFRQNEQMSMKLLTSEMEAWSDFTCLQMAVSSCHRAFVSHSCTQTLLTDLWSGPLNMSKNSFLKILLSLVLPPAVLLLEFKSKAEMCHVPQSHESVLFGLDAVTSVQEENDPTLKVDQDEELGPTCPVSESVSSVTVHCLSWIKRLYGFYTAPVVKFWFHTVFYLAFLMLFSFVVLVKMEDQPSVQEWLVIAYILSTAVEKIREVLMSEPRKLSHKLKIWFSEYWNKSDFIAILLFLAGLTLRWHADPYKTAGRIAYCLDIIFWFIRVTDLLAVNQHAGPYLTMITKMTSNMFFIVVMMAIVLLSFGVSRKAILSPDEDPSWTLARDVVFQPYWMIYGEVYATEINPCDDGVPCAPASFLTPFLQAVYMFFQYIIMVNILIAFFNNIYFDMASTSSRLWRYNRHRYIITYQERPWLPPPLIILSHMTLALTTIYARLSGDAEREETGSGLKLHLGLEDRKKLHEFEEKCVEVYVHERREGSHSSEAERIRATADRAEEMCVILGEVSEKVDVIQDSLLALDAQLGQLQDLSALAMDTLTLLSASDSVHQEEARLAQSGFTAAPPHAPPQAPPHAPPHPPPHAPPHSWTFLHRSTGNEHDDAHVRRLTAQSGKSTPPSLLKGLTVAASRRTSLQEVEDRGRKRVRQEDEGEKRERGGEKGEEDPQSETWSGLCRPASHHHGHFSQTPCESCAPSRCGSPHLKFWIGDPYLYPSQEEISMEEEEEGEDEGHEGQGQGQGQRMKLSRNSSTAVLLSDPRDVSEGFVNPAFSQDSSRPTSPSRSCHAWGRPVKVSRWTCVSRDRPYGYCRSLSSSMENMTFCGAPLSPTRGSFPSLCDTVRSGGRSFRDDVSLRCSSSKEWSKSSDFSPASDSRGKTQSRKTVKIQDRSPDSGRLNLSDICWRRRRWLRGEATCLSTSMSLSQLNFEPMDLLQKQVFSHQEVWSPTHSAWNSWARSMSRRSSLQSNINPEVNSSSFQSTDHSHPHYSAVERNNLMRLAHTIPFTPVSILGGEEVSVYSLDEVSSVPDSVPVPEDSSVSSWSSQALSAVLQPLSSEEGSLDGGLRLGRRVLCTWAERDVLRPGLVYVVKAFRPEVVRSWQRHFHGSTVLQLCLREIQQQRAAQKMMKIFNQNKPEDLQHTPRFLDVSLVLWHSNGQWLTIERNMPGEFRKYNNNTGEEIAPCCSLEETLLAFSHWTFEYSNRELLVLDIQGVGEELTDPTVIMAENQSGNRGEMLFGADNLGDAAVRGFLQKHSCSSCCRRLGLRDLRMSVDDCEISSSSSSSSSSTEAELTPNAGSDL
ncbi:transient receptor potential cation channel subfamily M member 7-like isoform X1 [Solea senegalensis]|uniref:Transient receptor potential cation channel subfamily M member 7-like isoform X1 n=1 Tax=Solea senegalensis TaxID=28829 RepID=A0AAV6QJV1_SOLSE|nr:transient receptor potential cation channel subfamily M member 7-like isoform X1 [Solea senegalensis]